MSAVELLYRAAMNAGGKKSVIYNAQTETLLNELIDQTESVDLIQYFKPEVNALQNMGLSVSNSVSGEYDTALILPSKNKQQSLGWMAEAINHLKDGGNIIMACANTHGAKSYEAALQKLAGNIASKSKSKCRLFSVRKTESLNQQLATQWLDDARPGIVESHGLLSQAGLFSWDRADAGSALLLNHLPELSGSGMDLCSGYGLLSASILKHAPDIQKLHLVEADQLALECAAKNTLPWHEIVTLHWLDAATETLPTQLDWVVCNPPFHSGQSRDVELGQRIVQRACESLKTGGTLYLVANRQLPYEQLLRNQLQTCRTLIESDGFKVFEGIK